MWEILHSYPKFFPQSLSFVAYVSIKRHSRGHPGIDKMGDYTWILDMKFKSSSKPVRKQIKEERSDDSDYEGERFPNKRSQRNNNKRNRGGKGDKGKGKRGRRRCPRGKAKDDPLKHKNAVRKIGQPTQMTGQPHGKRQHRDAFPDWEDRALTEPYARGSYCQSQRAPVPTPSSQAPTWRGSRT